MAIRKDDSYYTSVSAGQEVISYQVPADGKEWLIEEFIADAPSSSDGYVALVWDYDGTPEYIMVSYTSVQRPLIKSITGDGTKKLAIVLHNGGSDTLVMGGSYKVREL
jgi:hypothetical protein